MQKDTSFERTSVSVVMCTYNGEAYIEEQLQSILQQTYPIQEILISDDGSTDETINIIQKIASQNSNIKLHINEINLGYNQNFQQAFSRASGDVIAVSDQDDIWAITKIERMLQAWEPSVPLIYCYSYQFKDVVPENPKIHPLFRRYKGKDGRRIFMFNTVSGHAMLFRKEFLKVANPFPDNITYDWWMAVVASYNGGVQYLPEILVFQRRHNNNQTLHIEGVDSKQVLRDKFKKEVVESIGAFEHVPNMPRKDKKMLLRLLYLLKESSKHKFSWPLFLFFLRYNKTIFSYKKRHFEIITRLKESYRRSKS